MARKSTGAAYPPQTEWLIVPNGSHDEPELSLCITKSSNNDVQMFLQNAPIESNQCLAHSAKTRAQHKRNKCFKNKTKELFWSPHNRRQKCCPLQYYTKSKEQRDARESFTYSICACFHSLIDMCDFSSRNLCLHHPNQTHTNIIFVQKNLRQQNCNLIRNEALNKKKTDSLTQNDLVNRQNLLK